MSNITNNFTIYTDGACSGNPGIGGWGAIIFSHEQKTKTIIYGGEKDTTNNRMELKAVIKAIEDVHNNTYVSIVLYTDSKYVQTGLQNWIINWKKNGWKTSKKEDVKNRDLWEKLDQLSSNIDLTLKYVKAHHTCQFNNEVDNLAKLGKIALNNIIRNVYQQE